MKKNNSKKLIDNKKIIANLNNQAKKKVKGGQDVPVSSDGEALKEKVK